MLQRAHIVALVLLAGCFGRQAPDVAVGEPVRDERPRVAIYVYGFFNSEDPARFAPEPIEYTEVDLEQAHERLIPRVGQSGFRRSTRALSRAETSELIEQSTVPRAEARQRLVAALDVLDAMANDRPPQGDQLRELRSPVAFPNWSASDRVLLVLGLETMLRDSTTSGLRSLVGCFWFNGVGDSVTFVPIAYDYRLLDTTELVQLVGERCDPPLSPPAS